MGYSGSTPERAFRNVGLVARQPVAQDVLIHSCTQQKRIDGHIGVAMKTIFNYGTSKTSATEPVERPTGGGGDWCNGDEPPPKGGR